MKDEQLRVLKIMNEVTHRMDLNEFARMVELNANEALECIQDLARTGLLKKSGGGYGITEKGKAVLNAQTIVADGLEFTRCREGFANWVQAVVKDEVLATELENVRQSELRGESLRKRLAAAIEKRYDAEALR